MFDVTGVALAPRAAVLDTPLGDLATHFEGGGQTTAGLLPDETIKGPSGVFLHRFRRAGWIAELLIGLVEPEIPAHMAVAGCLAAIWRIQAIEHTHACRFVCSWPNPPAEADGSPSPGEGLDAFTWRVGRYAISLGTEDGEFLSARAERSDFVPARLSGELSFHTVEYTEAGLVVPFSGLGPSEILQVQFVVAWTCEHTDESPASWFAVEQSPAFLLQQLLRLPA
jgi:hypothetical protein